jgi:biopolymer transport protein ExbB
VVLALAMVSLASPLSAQQSTAPAPLQPPALSQPAANPAEAAPNEQVKEQVKEPVPQAAVVAPSAAAPAASDAIGMPVDASRPLKSATAGLRELSPLSMFLAADILVKAVMIGLAFASLVTWTICIAKMVELTLVRRRLRAALGKISEAKSLSAGISSDAGIKERAASSFAEIVRAEARRIHFGMGVLATIGATSPFVGLFGTVWGIMNSFIGISKSQTTNLAVVAPGIAEALLATAFGLAAAIPAVIIYNHFARTTKGYLELVGRASGAAARLLSRDLDRTHVAAHSRAAE